MILDPFRFNFFLIKELNMLVKAEFAAMLRMLSNAWNAKKS